ncbi:DUF262 domain-containing protein [Capnocytophaga sputigena]|jgi:hypothetical protein|uniref:DUF262 domain-containing protein n=1 Tax=Capnocytophaga sputigena TaxID=1019 RepID=UPI0028D67110|nr:DUF262 domain-containing protein [Capnocytophaga sputigena]
MNIDVKINDNFETVNFSIVKKEETDNRYLFINRDDDQILLEVETDLENKTLKIISKEVDIDDEEFNEIVGDAFAKIIDLEQSGINNSEGSISTEYKPYDPEKIKLRTDKISLAQVSAMIDNRDIDLTPEFQRNLVWDPFRKSRLIESILLRIPLPMFYFSEDLEGRFTIIDGLQRISAIKEFMENKFSLKNLQYLENCEGKYFKDEGNKKGLEAKYVRWFNLTNISANIIDPISPPQVKYDIFRRINTGGKPLNNQEIRNCLAGQGLRDTLKAMVNTTEFKTATDNSVRSTRMDDQEIALRFLAFEELFSRDRNINDYSGYMESFLDDYTERHKRDTPQDFEDKVQLFVNAMKNATYLIGGRYAFRKILPESINPNARKQILNKALFVVTSLLLSLYPYEEVIRYNKEGQLTEITADTIVEDDQLYNYLSYSTNSKANMLYVFKIFNELFIKHISI